MRSPLRIIKVWFGAVGVVNPVANQCWIRHFIPFQGDQTGAVDVVL